MGGDDTKGMVNGNEGVRSLGGREMSRSIRDGIRVCVVVVVVVAVVLLVVVVLIALMESNPGPLCMPAHIMSHSSPLHLCYPVQKHTFTPQQWHQDFRANPTEGCQSLDPSSLYFPSPFPHTPPHTFIHISVSIT